MMFDPSTITKGVYLTDTHAGGRNDAKWLLNAQEEFYTKQFFPYMIQNGIRHIWHLGDFFDRRKFISFEILHAWKRFFFEPLRQLGFHMEIELGNHDIRFVNTTDVNSLHLLVSESYSDCVTIYDKPTEVVYNNGGYKVAWLPWVTPDQMQTALTFLANTDAVHVNAHMDCQGFEMQRNQFATHGFDSTVFAKFKRVRTGHYHKRSTQGNITYIGSPTEYTWADYAEPRGFCAFDLEADTETFVDNPTPIFAHYHYNPLDTNDKIKEAVTGKISKIFVSEEARSNKKKYEKFLDFLSLQDTIDYSVIEISKDIVTTRNEDGEIVQVSTDTESIITKYVDDLDLPEHIDKARLQKYLLDIHKETMYRQEHGEASQE